jgi:hypothetical protein
MKTISITVERNFHIMNDDRFIMEKISMTKELEGDDDAMACVNDIRLDIEDNFKAAYPHLRTYLNFDEVTQVKYTKQSENVTSWEIVNPSETNGKHVVSNPQFYDKPLPQEKINKGTIEEQKEWKYPVATVETIKKEIQNFNKSIALFQAIYSPQCTGNSELETVYTFKLNELKEKYKPQTTK